MESLRSDDGMISLPHRDGAMQQRNSRRFSRCSDDGKRDSGPKVRVVSSLECTSCHVSVTDMDIVSWFGQSDLRLNSDMLTERRHRMHGYKHGTCIQILALRKYVPNIFGDCLDVQLCEVHSLSKVSIFLLRCAAEANLSVGVLENAKAMQKGLQ